MSEAKLELFSQGPVLLPLRLCATIFLWPQQSSHPPTGIQTHSQQPGRSHLSTLEGWSVPEELNSLHSVSDHRHPHWVPPENFSPHS
uniref:Uncharacterized protein n=1 Tax=Erpetoichthys calabaricus TaxID=27687 RepID=A0A8C4SMD8_ERPCA